MCKTDVVDGLDTAPAALNRLFRGANAGKVMVKLWVVRRLAGWRWDGPLGDDEL